MLINWSRKKLRLALLNSLWISFFCINIAAENAIASQKVQPSAQNSTQDKFDYLLPRAITNNAVAIAEVDNHKLLFSFAGLDSGKTYKDVSAKVFSFNLSSGESKQLAPLPDAKGRLASIAVTVNNQIYLFGGYTVAADHSEISTPEVYRFDPSSSQYELISKMPVPVDDSVALVYQQRYIYLVSGWHNTDNVDQVQVFDTLEKRWFEATAFPGSPVFGHAGGIVGNRFIIADGVKVNGRSNGKNQYAPSDENWLAEIDPTDPAKISWKKIPKHPFAPLYRMASVGLTKQRIIVFAGGSDNPYNFNGIGYDGNPSQPSKRLFGYDLSNNQWKQFHPLHTASMDHRGLLTDDNALFILGGMGQQQQVLNTIQKVSLHSLLQGPPASQESTHNKHQPVKE